MQNISYETEQAIFIINVQDPFVVLILLDT